MNKIENARPEVTGEKWYRQIVRWAERRGLLAGLDVVWTLLQTKPEVTYVELAAASGFPIWQVKRLVVSLGLLSKMRVEVTRAVRRKVRALKPGEIKLTWTEVNAVQSRRAQVRRQVYQEKYRHFDWDKRDVDLARLYGVSREWIRQVRGACGAADSVYKNLRKNSVAVLTWLRGLSRQQVEAFRHMRGSEIVKQRPSTVSNAQFLRCLDYFGVRYWKIGSSFNHQVLVRNSRRTAAGCWLWTGCVHNGYPSFNSLYVRREVYKMTRGSIGKLQHVVTSCGCDLCVNPRHLKLIRNNSGPRVRRLTPELFKRLHVLRNQGLTYKQISERTGYPCTGLSYVFSRAAVK